MTTRLLDYRDLRERKGIKYRTRHLRTLVLRQLGHQGSRPARRRRHHRRHLIPLAPGLRRQAWNAICRCCGTRQLRGGHVE
jgi:hypothetical protein